MASKTTKKKTAKKVAKKTSKKIEKKELTSSEKLKKFEGELWKAACKLWTNSKLKPSDYKIPVLSLIFLRFADTKFEKVSKEIENKTSRRRTPGPSDYKAKGCVFLPEKARWDYIKSLPESAIIGAELNNAMELIMQNNEDLKGVLPKSFNRFKSDVLLDLMRVFNTSEELEGDTFGRIYEFFMSEFEKDSGQKGGEFFTPPSVVHLITEIIEPYHGKIFDPACGSGGMFVSSAKFVEAHKKRPSEELAAFGQEKTAETIRIAKMNLAINGFSGSIKDANSYYDDVHNSTGQFDFVMANPPFNAKGIDFDRIKDDKRRFPFGMPSANNGNYVWIQMFYSSLKDTGRAGFVMANSASDAGHSEKEIRKKIIKNGIVDVVISTTSNLFYTVGLPCSLWFFDKGKPETRKNKVLFIDASNLFDQVSRSLREYTEEQIEFFSNIVRLYRGEPTEFKGENELFNVNFPEMKYKDIKALCKVADIEEIEAQDWSLNPGRYVGSDFSVIEDSDFNEFMSKLKNDLENLNEESNRVYEDIVGDLKRIGL